MKVENVSAAVLAGGFSKRMGANKAELKLGEQTLLEIQIQKFRQLGISDIMVSGYEKPIEGTRPVPDIYEGKGPLGGVHACLKAAAKPACLILSVDTPLVPVEILSELIEAHEGPATVLSHGEQIEPLIAVYDSALAARAEERIINDNFSIRTMANNAEVKRVEFKGDMDLLLNCNAPEDFEKAQSLWK